MRTEKEMFDLILQTAQKDKRIRAVILEGSRANSNSPRDILQDYDIVYIVEELAPFVNDPSWAERFGELLIMQMPDTMQDPPSSLGGHFTYLMQFRDGTRIDLSFYTFEAYRVRGRDSLSVLLLDKDHRFENFSAADKSDYYPKPPTAKTFSDCCNEFWWISIYVAKGLWRNEITYAKFMLDEIVRAQLMKLLIWYIGMQTNFHHNPGKQGKYFQTFLSATEWDSLLKTYADADIDHNWEALYTMAELFQTTALQVADRFHFSYPEEEYLGVLEFLKSIQRHSLKGRNGL